MGTEDPEGCAHLPLHWRVSVYRNMRDRIILGLDGPSAHDSIWLLGRLKVPLYIP